MTTGERTPNALNDWEAEVAAAQSELERTEKQLSSYPAPLATVAEPIRQYLLKGGPAAEQFWFDTTELLHHAWTNPRTDPSQRRSNLPGHIFVAFIRWWVQYLARQKPSEELAADVTPQFISLDEPLLKQDIFSTRATNALVRAGIVTLRLLLIHSSELLLNGIPYLGDKTLAEIEQTLAAHGLRLAPVAEERDVLLSRLLTRAFTHRTVSHPLDLRDLRNQVNNRSISNTLNVRMEWSKVEVAAGADAHPYVEKLNDGRYAFEIRPPANEPTHPVFIPDPDLETTPRGTYTTPMALPERGSDVGGFLSNSTVEADKADLPNDPNEPAEQPLLNLSAVWPRWIELLSERERMILTLLYGIDGEEPGTLQEAGEELSLTRERVRQIKNKALRKLQSMHFSHWQPIKSALAECIGSAHGLLKVEEWERWLDERAVWTTDKPRPMLLHLLCDLFGSYHYLDSYNVATKLEVSREHLAELDSILNRIARRYRQVGLTADGLTAAVQAELPSNSPSEMRKPDFILKMVDLVDQVDLGQDGRYVYLRKKKKRLYPAAASGWTGKPGTRLHEWEQRLRRQFKAVDWIGQLALTEADFADLCQAIQSEAQAPNYFSKEVEGQPRLLPPAVFMTTMVFSARYAEQRPEEAVDEFWAPYMRTVWNVAYSQAFYVRCKKRFNAVVQFLEDEYRFVFPRTGASLEVVTPIFRHALIPRYMQSDFAAWLHRNWRAVLQLAETPALLAIHLENEPSLTRGDYSHRLAHFITGKSTQETATALITTMVSAISMHVNDGESIERISALLVNSPIEREIWHELAGILKSDSEADRGDEPSTLRSVTPRLTWLWSVDESELVLRVQNIVLPAESDVVGEPDRLVWMEAKDDDPLDAEIEATVSPWHMDSGERMIPDLLISEPDGSLAGELVLLTDMDDVALRLDVPAHPTAPVQFFRITQQGAYGVPVDVAQVHDGSYLVCAKEQVAFYEDDLEAEIVPDSEFHVPYPLDERYGWAAQITLSLPAVAIHGAQRIEFAAPSIGQTTDLAPSLVGNKRLHDLSPQIQPIFADTQIAFSLQSNLDALPKQTLLRVSGQQNWRWQRSLAELRQQGHLTEMEDGFRIELGLFLPNEPDSYTIELQANLQPLLDAPLQFAVIPNLEVEILSVEPIYTPATPFQVIMRGVDSSVIVRSPQTHVMSLADRTQQITWRDYRNDPQVLLRFEKAEIPLMWSVPRFMAWMEPPPTKAYLSLQEMHQTTLHARSKHPDLNRFDLFLADGGSRSFPMRRNRASVQLGKSQLYDMVKLGDDRRSQVHVQVYNAEWKLFEVHRQPSLTGIAVTYNDGEEQVEIITGLTDEWSGNLRFLVQSLTNPFQKRNEIGTSSHLAAHHQFRVSLVEGIYLLQIELDGVLLSLDEQRMQFTVGASQDLLDQSQDLIKQIRSGALISSHHAEDFVLWWAELASSENVELTASTTYQLSTIPVTALENFTTAHLEQLWSPLAALKEVSESATWAEEHGLLPAWIFLTTPMFFKTLDRGYRLPVYPIEVLDGGFRGKGYARWRLFPREDAPKEFVYVQWAPVSQTVVQVEAGLPATKPGDWSTVDILDTYGLHYCVQCGRLTGARSLTLPQEIQQLHCHGHDQFDLRNVTVAETHGGHQLLAELFPERRGESLMEIFENYDVPIHSGAASLPEPAVVANGDFLVDSSQERLGMIARELLWRTSSNEISWRGSANRLLARWANEERVSRSGRQIVALGLLLRLAAAHPHAYFRLLKRFNLSEGDMQALLEEIAAWSPAHLAWGLTWAELLIRHSSGPAE